MFTESSASDLNVHTHTQIYNLYRRGVFAEVGGALWVFMVEGGHLDLVISRSCSRLGKHA